MSAHTKGRLIPHHEASAQIGLYADGHGYIAFVHVGGQAHWARAQRENARRLVACWNACVHLDTAYLESMPRDPRGQLIDGLLGERGELLDALNGMVGLVQLIQAREDVPAEIRKALVTSHRYTEAQSVSAKHEPPPAPAREGTRG